MNAALSLRQWLHRSQTPYLEVLESDPTVDFALFGYDESVVVRCVKRVHAFDLAALRTMLAQGDFDRAILLHSERGQAKSWDEVESWWIGDIEALGASLAREHSTP